MDFGEGQYDSLSLRYYRGVMSHKKFCKNRTNLKLIRECLGSKMPSLKFRLLKRLNYHKGFDIIAIVIENNRIHC